ncbi:hypothetical protein HPB47_019414 [Ixodes persulcatus]|uniref:Uncharacterized protein n=1 Tax=Ixodes persulcatus TaxID=34615 RepID=A0AC60QLS9_IXOPE|nr:hypothetical protein HPB47_019414 [Ixodes persulcatus]
MNEDRGPPTTPGRLYRKGYRNLSPISSSNASVASFSSEAESALEDGTNAHASNKDEGDGFTLVGPKEYRRGWTNSADTVVSKESRPASRNTEARLTVLLWPTDKAYVRKFHWVELNAHFDVIAPRQVKEIRVNGRRNVIAVDVHLKDAVPKLLLVKKLGGIPVEARVPWTADHIAGVVRDVDQCLSEEDIHNTMQAPAHILGLRRQGKSTTVRVTFEGKDLPQYVHMGYVRHPVALFVSRPLQCFRCNRMGHIAAVFERERTCAKCSGNHDTSTCKSETARCVNCRREHAATSSECPVLSNEWKVCKQRARSTSTHTEARAALRKQNTDKLASRRGAPPTAASGAHSSEVLARLPKDNFPPLVARRTGAKEMAGNKDVTRFEPTESKRQFFAHVARDAGRKTPSTEETTDAALPRMISRLFRAVRELAQARRQIPEAKFALEVLDADVPTVLQWNCRGFAARHSELTLHLQRYRSPVLVLVEAGLPGKRTLPGGSGHFPIHITVKGCQIVRKDVRSCTNWDVFRAPLGTSHADIETAIVQALQEATHRTCISEWLPNPYLTFLNLQVARTRAQQKYQQRKNPEDKTQFNRVSAKL